MTTAYYRVRLGRLDSVNGPNEYPMPNRTAAIKFATQENAMHPRRVVMVKDPQGRTIKRYGPKQMVRRKAS